MAARSAASTSSPSWTCEACAGIEQDQEGLATGSGGLVVSRVGSRSRWLWVRFLMPTNLLQGSSNVKKSVPAHSEDKIISQHRSQKT